MSVSPCNIAVGDVHCDLLFTNHVASHAVFFIPKLAQFVQSVDRDCCCKQVLTSQS